jgi:hypothetical protein
MSKQFPNRSGIQVAIRIDLYPYQADESGDDQAAAKGVGKRVKEIANNGSIVIYVYGPLSHRQIENAFYKIFLPDCSIRIESSDRVL